MNRVRTHTRGGFTLTELVVVIVIILIVVAIIVPATQGILASQNAARARDVLEGGVRLARQSAIESGVGRDTAVVFLHQPGESIVLVPCIEVGQILDENSSGDAFLRKVFVPDQRFESLQLPVGWMVRGYAPEGSMSSDPSDPRNDWYYDTSSAHIRLNDRNWVFPETGYYGDEIDEGDTRQTFMIRFEGGTGRLSSEQADPAIVLAPVPETSWRTNDRNDEWQRADRAEDFERFVQRILASSLPRQDKLALIGDRATDTVLARGLTELALYEEQALANAIGARVDRESGTLYRAGEETPGLVSGADGEDISRWIEGDTDLSGSVSDPDEPDAPVAQLFTIDRFSGRLLEVEVQQP